MKGDADSTSQVRPQNNDHGPDLARRGTCFHEWAESHRQAEDRAAVVGPAPGRRAVEVAVGGLDQPRLRELAGSDVSTHNILRCRGHR